MKDTSDYHLQELETLERDVDYDGDAEGYACSVLL